ncbi:MAG: DEAD/DEAH box helicase [bacterium]
MRPRQAASDSLKTLVNYWKSGSGAGRSFTAIHHVPAREATHAAFPTMLDARLEQMMRQRGITQLYSHQAAAITHALEGRNVVVVTPTASGKSLCYHLPVIDAIYQDGSALYIYPTKALSQDQTSELNQLLGLCPDGDDSWEAQVYDGDTPPDVRRRIRRSGRLVVTNLYMLHSALLPHHDKWAHFFRSLKFVILDELHTYRGVFGSHVANVVRRLKRICAHYGTNPVFLATSATIANPKELAQALTELPFELVNENGAPAAEKYVCFMNPPIKDLQQMRRQSALSAAQGIAKTTLEKECGTIVFTRSRQSVEVLIKHLKERFKHDRAEHLANRVASYRGGYLPNLRRSIERGLRDGSVLGVVSTNALELGIDIGSLDVCVLAGYPGTVASTWQQFGRAGRNGGTSLSVLVASDEPLDQFIIQNPLISLSNF